jgi:tetratricopeptide (TPR) repeat protein
MSMADEGTVAERLRQADALRDSGLWDAAAAAYSAYLAVRPEDWGVRVQLGHCLKEAGDIAAALAAYREAALQAPASADPHLHIGHALRLLGETEAAWRAYARALELDPENGEAARGAAALAAHATAAPRHARARPGRHSRSSSTVPTSSPMWRTTGPRPASSACSSTSRLGRCSTRSRARARRRWPSTRLPASGVRSGANCS